MSNRQPTASTRRTKTELGGSAAEPRRAAKPTARVYRTIRQQILDGGLEPGAHLSQQALAQAMNVSNGPVISALRRLTHDGLVSYEPSRGYRVCEWTREKLDDHLTVRRALETEAACLAARRAGPEDIEQLRALVERMAEAVRLERRVEADVLDVDLHMAIARLSRCPGLVEALSRSHVMETVRRRLRENEHLGDWENFAFNHGLLVDAIASGDPDRAGQAMHQHLRPKPAVPDRKGPAPGVPA